MIRIDLKRSGIPYRTAEGIADSDAAGRHPVSRSFYGPGHPGREAKELARHTDVNMTMRIRASESTIRPRRLQTCPRHWGDPGGKQAAKVALHGRCNLRGAGRHSPSPVGKGKPKPKPSKYQGNGQPLSSVVRAEGMGLEPTTGFPALEFQSSR
jgi:hypothetical protein